MERLDDEDHVAGQSFVARPNGLVLAPFRGLRYDTSVAGALADLTSPPYDVLDDADVQALQAASPYNVVRLILPRNGPDDGHDRYEAAATLLAEWRDGGVLRADPAPALYVYEQRDAASGHVQRGLLGALALPDPEAGVVLPHESTMPGPVQDRLALYEAVHADLEPIFLVYDGGGAASEVVAGADQEPPLVDVDLPDGLHHRLWAVADREVLAAVAADLLPRHALIADGHHRFATYLQRQERAHARGEGPGPWDKGLSLLVDTSTFGPQVAAIHRVVVGIDLDELVASSGSARVRTIDLSPDAATAQLPPPPGHAFVLASRDRCVVLEVDPDQVTSRLPPGRSAAWQQLDVTVLHHYVIPTLWRMTDSEEAVRFVHDVPDALRLADNTGGTAVLLRPTPVAAVAAVARAGDRMPRKSTLFTPKPRTGIVLRDFASEAGERVTQLA